jgi:hypothetical protein
MRHAILALLLFASAAQADCTATLPSYLIFGDSRAQIGWPSDMISDRLAARCPDATIYNVSRNGRGVFRPGRPWETTNPPLNQLQAALDLYPSASAVLLMLGYNDWDVPGITPEAVADGLKEMGDLVIANGAQPVVVTGFPSGDAVWPGRADWAAEVRFRQMALGAAMGWPVIDSWEAFDQRTWGPCTVTSGAPDWVHPYLASCRAAWADYVAPRLP